MIRHHPCLWRLWFVALFSLVGSSAGVGCASLLGADFDHPPPSGDAGDGGDVTAQPDVFPDAPSATPDVPSSFPADGGVDSSDASPCPGTFGPRGVPVVAEAGAYCIDSTEVTRADYAVFVASADPGSFPQPSFCAWNTTFTPSGWSDIPHDDRPVTNVDWCDAYMYCAWAGKRLCGDPASGVVCASAEEGSKLTLSCPSGQTVRAITFASYGNPSGACSEATVGSCHARTSWSAVAGACIGQASCDITASSDTFGGDPCFGTPKRLVVRAACGVHVGGGDPHTQWGAVCTRDDAYKFPYGNVYEPGWCNGGYAPGADASTAPVASFARCEASPGIFDMSGNADEWVDSCDIGQQGAANDVCAYRGGNFHSDDQGMSCGTTWVAGRSSAWDAVGFRCCSSP